MDFSRNIRIVKQDIQTQKTECIVNAANENLQYFPGLCGVVFDAAGRDAMSAACSAIGHCPVGKAVATEGFALNARYVIHTVAPCLSQTGRAGLPQLRNAYLSAMEQIHRHGCHRAVFPLLCSGASRGTEVSIPELWETAFAAVRDYMSANPSHRFEIVFACHGSDVFSIGSRVLCIPAQITPIPPTILGNSSESAHSPSLHSENQFIFFPKQNEVNSCFSLWYPATIEVEGIRYDTCAQYMMAKKALLFGDIEHYFLILNTSDPKLCEDYGKAVRNTNSDRWQDCIEEILFNATFAKFTQHPELAKILLETGKRVPAETDPQDTYFGIGLEASHPDVAFPEKWPGKNRLGECLMEVRALLQASQG